MDNTAKTSFLPKSHLDHVSKDQTTENVVDEDPPSYQSLNSEARNLTINNAPKTISSQPQRTTMGNIGNSAITSASPLGINSQRNDISNYEAWSVLNTLCCCLCLGLAACYYSHETDAGIQRGDIVYALNASKNARTFNIIATITGIIIGIIYIMSVFLRANALSVNPH